MKKKNNNRIYAEVLYFFFLLSNHCHNHCRRLNVVIITEIYNKQETTKQEPIDLTVVQNFTSLKLKCKSTDYKLYLHLMNGVFYRGHISFII